MTVVQDFTASGLNASGNGVSVFPSQSSLPTAEKLGKGIALGGNQLVVSDSSRKFYNTQFPTPIVGAIGDSITANGVYGGSTNVNAYSYGQVSWLFAGARQSGGSWIAGAAQGVGGYTSAQILAACPTWEPLIDTNGTHVAVFAGTNDYLNSITVAQSISNIQKIWDLVANAGKIPIACSLLPRNSIVDAQYTWYLQHYALLRKAAERYGIPCADFMTACLDTASGNAINWKANYPLSGDNVHPGPAGAWAMGGALHTAISSTPGSMSRNQMKALYQSTAAGIIPVNNLFRTITGTINVSGSAPGAPWSGSALAGSPTTTVYDLAGFAAAYPTSSMAPYGGSNVFEMAINPANNYVTLSQVSAPMTGFSAGDRVGFCFNFKVIPAAAEIANLPGFHVSLQDAGNVTVQMMRLGKPGGISYVDPSNTVANGGMADEGYVYMERSLPATLTATGLYIYASLSQTAGKTGGKLLLSNLMVINYTTGNAILI